MTGPPRDVRADAIRAFTRRLQHEGCRVPDLLARELIVLLDSHQIGLTDRRAPVDPDARILPLGSGIPAAADTDGLAAYRAARAAHAQKDQP